MRRFVLIVLGLVALGAAGFGAGFGVGHSEREAVTTTVTKTTTRTTVEVKTIRTVKTVRVQPTVTYTETRTRTLVVTQPPTSSFLDYGERDGYFRAYSINGYRDDLGWKVV